MNKLVLAAATIGSLVLNIVSVAVWWLLPVLFMLGLWALISSVFAADYGGAYYRPQTRYFLDPLPSITLNPPPVVIPVSPCRHGRIARHDDILDTTDWEAFETCDE